MQNKQKIIVTFGKVKINSYFCGVYRVFPYIASTLVMVVFGTIIYLQLMQVQLLKAIVERPEIATVVSDDGVIDHAEQRSDNNVTIMFNYE